MEDIVAVEAITPSGGPHFVMTFGRVQDATDPAALEEIVLAQAGAFGLGDATGARVCRSLQEASSAPYFFEAIISFSAAMADARSVDDFSRWRNTTDAAMREGRHLYYLGGPTD